MRDTYNFGLTPPTNLMYELIKKELCVKGRKALKMKNLKRRSFLRLISLIIISTTLFTFTNCEKKKEKVIKIGAILPLTGNLAFLGEPVRDALLLAQKDINTKAKFRIKLIIEDSKGDVAQSVNIAQRLINIEKVNVLFPFLTGVVQAVKKIAEEKKLLTLAQSVYPPILKDTKYTFRIFYSFDSETKEIVNYVNSMNYRKLFIVRANDQASEYQVLNYLIPLLRKSKINFREEVYALGQKDFREISVKAKNYQPEALIILGFGSDFPNILRALIEVRVVPKTPIVGGIGFIELPKNTIEPKYLQNITFFGPAMYAIPEGKNFMKKFKTQTGKEPNYAAAYAYDNLIILKMALQKLSEEGKEFTTENLTNAIWNLKEYNGVSGKIRILSNRDVTASCIQYRFDKMGNFIPVAEH